MQQCPVHIGRGTLFCPTILKGTVAVKRLDTARRLRRRLGKFCADIPCLPLIANEGEDLALGVDVEHQLTNVVRRRGPCGNVCGEHDQSVVSR